MANCFSISELSSWTHFAVPAIACCLWFIWRLWRFSLASIWSPTDPEQLPYWVPFLGHAFAFDKDPQALLALGHNRFARAGRPYGLTVAGKTFYVFTDPQDFSTIYRHAATFNFDPLVEYIYRVFQIPEASIRNLYRKPMSSGQEHKSSDPPNNNAVNVSHKMMLVEVRGKHHCDTYTKIAEQLRRSMNLETICSRFSTTRDGSSTVISLLQLCSIMVIRLGQDSHFGSALSDIDSSIPDAFLEFDKHCWQIFQRPPILWSKQLRKVMTRLLTALQAYSSKPMDGRPGMPQFLKNWETECRNSELHDSDLAKLMLIQYFGLNTNTYKACFWLLSHIVFNPDLISIIRTETSPAFPSNNTNTIDWSTIESSQTLNGIWLETLRLSTSPVTLRHITADFQIKGLKLRKGNLAILNPRPLQINAEYFGSQPLDFDVKRFVHNPALERHPGYRPFGGGDALCSGRQKAKQTALTFVACLLHEFDVDLAWPQEFPESSPKAHPGVSVRAPAQGVDLWLRLRRRVVNNEGP